MQQVPVGCAGLTSSFWPAATCCLCSVSLQHGQIRLNLETHTQSFFNHFREHYINLPSFPGDQIVSTTYPSPRFTSPGTSFSPQMELYCTQHISDTQTHTGSKWWRCLWGRKETSKPINGSRAQWRLSLSWNTPSPMHDWSPSPDFINVRHNGAGKYAHTHSYTLTCRSLCLNTLYCMLLII